MTRVLGEEPAQDQAVARLCGHIEDELITRADQATYRVKQRRCAAGEVRPPAAA